MKIYKKGLVFLVAKAVKDVLNHLLKLQKVFSQEPMPQFIPAIPSLLEPSRVIRNFPSP